MLKLIAPFSKKRPIHLEDRDSDSETENISVARTSTPVKISTTTKFKTTPVNSRNMVTGVLNDSKNQPTKRPKQQRVPSEPLKERPSTSKILFASAGNFLILQSTPDAESTHCFASCFRW